MDITSIAEGNIVIVRDDAVPKLCWKLACVLKNVTGNDGIVCAFRLKLADGKAFTRSIKHLCFLEMHP